jgi:hypothetical protein
MFTDCADAAAAADTANAAATGSIAKMSFFIQLAMRKWRLLLCCCTRLRRQLLLQWRLHQGAK